MNNLSLAGSILISPLAAIKELRERPRFVFPLIAFGMASTVLLVWYLLSVDFEWLKANQIAIDPGFLRIPEEKRAKALAAMSVEVILFPEVLKGLIALPMAFALQAAYFLVAGKVTGVRQGFTQWFALICWTNFPIVIELAAAMVLVANAGTGFQFGLDALKAFSFNELFFHAKRDEPGFMLFSSLGFVGIWSWALCIAGVRQWSNRSWLFSSAFVMLPFIAIYGVLAALWLKG